MLFCNMKYPLFKHKWVDLKLKIKRSAGVGQKLKETNKNLAYLVLFWLLLPPTGMFCVAAPPPPATAPVPLCAPVPACCW